MSTVYVDALLIGAKKQLIQRNFDKALKLGDKALHISKNQSDAPRTQAALIEIGKILHKKGVYQHKDEFLEEALLKLNQAKEIREANFNRKIELLVEIAMVYAHKKEFEKAVEILDHTLPLCKIKAYKTEELRTLNALSKLGFERKKFREALEFAETGQQLITPQTMEELRIENYQILTRLYIKTGQFDKIPHYAQPLIELSEKINNAEGAAQGFAALATVNLVKGDYKKGFEYLTKSNKKAEDIQLISLIATNTVNLGVLFRNLYNDKEAIRHYLLVLDNYSHILSSFNQCAIHFNLGGAYLFLEEQEKSLEHFFKALDITKKYKLVVLQCRIYFEISNVYINAKDFEQGAFYIKKAQNSYTKHDDIGGTDSNLINFAALYYYEKDYENALKYALEGIKKATTRNNTKTQRRGYQQLAKIYRALERPYEAYDALETYSEINEKFMKEMRKRQLIDLEIQYNIKVQQQEIAMLKQEMKHQKTIEAQNAKLKMNNEELKQFTYAISHDLKEPLRMIGSFSRLWMKRHRRNADKRDKEYFHYISGGVDRMTTMLNGLLDYATIGTNARKTTSVDLNELVLTVKETLYVKIQENNAKVHIESLPTIVTHKLLLFQLFQNLVSNAIKFRKKAVDPIVTISAQLDGEQYIFSIKDNGIGISEDHQQTIFVIFKRLHTKEEYEGTGIGLSLCKKIVQQLGGSIWLESILGKGTTFFFSLPKKL